MLSDCWINTKLDVEKEMGDNKTMGARILIPKLEALTPKALPLYREAFKCANIALVPFGILNNTLRAAHFLAQVLHESGGLSLSQESLNYTTAARIAQV